MSLRKTTRQCLVYSWVLFDRNFFGLLLWLVSFPRLFIAFFVLKLARIVYYQPIKELDQLLDQKKKAVADQDFRKVAQIRDSIDPPGERWLRALACQCVLDTDAQELRDSNY